MPSKLENTLPLIISVRKWVGSVFTSGLLRSILLKVKVKKSGMLHKVNFTSEKNYGHSKMLF